MEIGKLISIGDKIDLKQIRQTLREDEKVPVYPSRLLDIKENSVLQMAMPFYEGKIVPLAVGDKYEIWIYAKNGLYTCKCVIVERYKTGNMFFMDVAMYTELTKVQRREYYRFVYRTNVECRIVKEELAKGNVPESQEEFENATWYNAVMMDLSGGGIRIVSAAEFDKGSYMHFRFPIKDAAGHLLTVSVYGQLLRSFIMENNPRLRDHRIEFVNIDKALQERIIRFIFEEERRNLSRGRN